MSGLWARRITLRLTGLSSNLDFWFRFFHVLTLFVLVIVVFCIHFVVNFGFFFLVLKILFSVSFICVIFFTSVSLNAFEAFLAFSIRMLSVISTFFAFLIVFMRFLLKIFPFLGVMNFKIFNVFLIILFLLWFRPLTSSIMKRLNRFLILNRELISDSYWTLLMSVIY